jgi:CheY-like chemotaxis protein
MARILLIDDYDLVRGLLREALELAGHTVIEARNGAEGVDLFRQAAADLVITDIVMPNTDGLAVVMALREHVPPVHIIAISGAGPSAEDYLDLAYRMGAVKVLLKPFTIAALIAAGAFVVLVLLLAVPLLKLGRTLDEATIAIRKAHEGSAPLLDDAQLTLRQVNTQLDRVDGITSNARTVTSNVSVLTSLFTATLGGPLVRAAAFSYGLNKAIKARRAGKDAGKHSRRARRKRAA